MTDASTRTSEPRTVVVQVTPVNDPPELIIDTATPGLNFATVFVEAGAPALLGAQANLSLIDVDNTYLQSVTFTITNVHDDGYEFVAIDSNHSAAGLVNQSVVTSPGMYVLTITAEAPVTVADMRALINSATYWNNISEPNVTQRVVWIVVNDGTDDSLLAGTTVDIALINDNTPVVSIDTAAYAPVLLESPNHLVPNVPRTCHLLPA